MSTTVTYKGDTLTTVNNDTKTLKTAGKYMEGDITLVDVTASGGIDPGLVRIYYTGSSAPSSSLGSNGDLYFQTLEV